MSSSFWAMGGYAAFVWPAYAVAAVLLGALGLASYRRWRAAERLAATLEGRRQRPKAMAGP